MLKRNRTTLSRTGPGTPMGELFRRYWLPALLARNCPRTNARRCG